MNINVILVPTAVQSFVFINFLLFSPLPPAYCKTETQIIVGLFVHSAVLLAAGCISVAHQTYHSHTLRSAVKSKSSQAVLGLLFYF